MRLAILADIHGNCLALDAVLTDLAQRGGADLIVNLGDCASGPLWPAETMDRLARLDAVTVRGNHDRVVAQALPGTMIASDRFAFDALAPDQRTWLGSLPLTAEPSPGVLAFHGTPTDDETYLIEKVESGRLARGDRAAIAQRLGDIGSVRIVLCGHSHRSDMVQLPSGVLVLNPGSVGCPAYHDPSEPAHVSEAGSSHARYVLLDVDVAEEPRVTLCAVPYASEDAARRAETSGRPDWAYALRTGAIHAA